MEKKPTLNLYDNETAKWRHDGKLYCLHIQRDEIPDDPRNWDNITIMACWHRRYSLGDELDDKTAEDFWQRLVRENVPESEIYAMAEAGRLLGIRIAENVNNPELVDIYETSYRERVFGKTEPKECMEYERVDKESVAYYLLDDLTVQHCMTLMRPYAEWLPLWLYDHSGITMSCGCRTGQYADRWDSGCVGWIVTLKKTIMAETVEYVLDENGERIWVEHQHEGHPPTWGYKTRPLTDEIWRKRAIEIMEGDVEVYDQYLTGDVFGFTLYEADPPVDDDEPEWEETHSCWGFYGPNVTENGICDAAGNGLLESIRSGEYETAQAVLHTISHYTF